MTMVVAFVSIGCTPLPWTEPVPASSGSQAAGVTSAPPPVPTPTEPAPAPTTAAGPGVRACADKATESTRGGKVFACDDSKGVVLLVEWHLEPDGKGRRAVGTLDRFQDGNSSLHATMATSDAAVIQAIETAETATLEVARENGVIRVGASIAVGEDYRTVTEVVTLFREHDTEAMWSGLGNAMESQMDACTKSRVATFAFPNETTVERTITSEATFVPQQLDPKLLATLKKECVAPKPKTEKFAVTAPAK